MDETTNQLVLDVRGMTCSHCEKRIETALTELPEIVKVKADHSRRTVNVTYRSDFGDAATLIEKVRSVLEPLSFEVVGEAQKPRIPTSISIAVLGSSLIALFLLISSQGWFNALPTIDSSVGLGMIFVAGILTSFHCIAMCGGIALSQSKPEQSPERKKASFRFPVAGLPYHLGRVVSYTVLGAIVGALGSVVSFTPLTKGILAGVASVFMLVLGLRMLGLLPQFKLFRLPKMPSIVPVSWKISIRKRGPFFVGLLNGLMPCGPLQTMQLYALGTGSVFLGAVSMFLFSLGTVPLMVTFGAISSFFSPRWQHRIVRASAVLIVFFGVVMAGRALDLSGASGQIQTIADRITGGNSALDSKGLPRPGFAVVKNGVQTVQFDLQPGSYLPITVQKGIPVTWTINATEDNLNGCNGEIMVPELNLRKKLTVGANVIQFTPEQTGTLTYTCWMGMISSSIRVVDNIDTASPLPGLAKSLRDQSLNPQGQLGGCCGQTPAAFAGGKIPTDQIVKADIQTTDRQTTQEVTITVDESGYSPAVVVVQKGIPARFVFVGKSLSSCNQIVDFPSYNGSLNLARGQLETPLIPVSQDFTFQCGMAMLHGYVRVVPDLNQVNMEEIRATVQAFRPAGGGKGGCCGP